MSKIVFVGSRDTARFGLRQSGLRSTRPPNTGLRRFRNLAWILTPLFTFGACSHHDQAVDEQAGDAAIGATGSSTTAMVPIFQGAGDSALNEPLRNGELCDYIVSSQERQQLEATECFFGPGGDGEPAATLEQVLECVDGQDSIHLRLTFNPNFVDNTYGAGSIGWPHKRGHRFSDLVKSDHAELLVRDGAGDVVLQFKLDYISADPQAPSGYASAGVRGGDGAVRSGDADWVLSATSSLDRNLNDRGYGDYVQDSPPTDAAYTANPETPAWDYRMVYEVWIDVAALEGNGFGGAFIEYVHASPAKQEDDTIDVTPGTCPPPDGECRDRPDGRCDPVDIPETPDPDEPCMITPDEPCSPAGLAEPDPEPERCPDGTGDADCDLE